MRTLAQTRVRSWFLTIVPASAALALALLAPATAAAQKQPVSPSPGGEGRIHSKEEIHDKREGHGTQETRNEHIPPIVVYDGSLTFETGKYPNAAPSGNSHRPHKYTLASGKRIYRVVVTAFTEDGIPYYYPWNFLDRGWEVRVWLQRLRPNPQNGYEDVPGNADEPQIIIRDSQEIEIDKPTLNDTPACQNTDNPIRMRRCQHASYGPTHFRIKRVEIVKGSRVEYPILPSDTDRDRVVISVFYRP